MQSIPDIEHLISNRQVFDDFIYTPLDKAVEILNSRIGDKDLEKKVGGIINNDVPAPLSIHPRAVLFRQLATPNYELRRFVSLVEPIHIKPLFWEYYEDKFTSNNEFKHSLGKLVFYQGKGKKGGVKTEKINIVDFNNLDGEKITESKTISGSSLIDFHHDLFKETYRTFNKDVFFDASQWFAKHGGNAKLYYPSFISLFVRHAILFEDFFLNDKEISFTRDIFLPAFIDVYKITGEKPLIVALEPTQTEGGGFWTYHPHQSAEYVKNKITSR